MVARDIWDDDTIAAWEQDARGVRYRFLPTRREMIQDRLIAVVAGALALACAVGATVQSVRLSRASTALADLQVVVAAERKRAAEDALVASEDYRREEKRRQEAKNAAIAEGEADARRARVGADAARAAGNGMRVRAADTARGGATAISADSGCDCTAAVEAGRVLADLLGKTVERSVVLAEWADSAHIAGKVCERSYDALTP